MKQHPNSISVNPFIYSYWKQDKLQSCIHVSTNRCEDWWVKAT